MFKRSQRDFTLIVDIQVCNGFQRLMQRRFGTIIEGEVPTIGVICDTYPALKFHTFWFIYLLDQLIDELLNIRVHIIQPSRL